MTQRVYYEHDERPQQQMQRKAARGDGGSPPLPSWKLYENPFYDGLAAAVVAAASAAAAVAMAGKHQGNMESEEDENEGDAPVQKQRFGDMPRASSASPPARRASLELATDHQRGEKVSWEQSQQLKVGACSMAIPSRSSAPFVRRASLSMAGRTSKAEAQANGNAATDEDVSTSMTIRPLSMQGALYGNDASMRRPRMMQGGWTNKDLRMGDRARPRTTSNVVVSPGCRALLGRTELHCKEAAIAMVDTDFDEENSVLLDRKPVCLESPSSPRSHLQPRPPSSTSDSPCSSKPMKAPKVSARSPQGNRSSQPSSPPLKTITLMRPKAGGGALRVRNTALKAASSSHRSPTVGDDAEQLLPPTDNYNFADTEIITSPRDYLKALSRSRGVIEEKRMDSSPVVSALSEELKRALNRVQELERFQTSARKEVDGLIKRFADERALLRNREQEKIQAAVFLIEDELDKERKLRKKLELENRKLSRNLAEANKAVVKAERELDKERKARQLMEDVCDELAREIGEDKAEVEELKREHARAREEMEEERRTLQMTEAWREERVQMKLSEAKYELEERCVALDKLKLELEMHLSSRQNHGGAEAYFDDRGEDLRAAAEKLRADTSWSMLLLENGSSHAPQSQDDALSSDDIHSLRLSRDNIRSQSEWGEYSDVRRDRAKWVIDYATEESGQFIASENVTGDESGKVGSKSNAYPDSYNRSLFSPTPLSRWGKTKASTAGLVGRQTGHINFEGSDSADDGSLDEENGGEVDSNEADSTYAFAGNKGYGNNQVQQSQWGAEGVAGMRELRGEVDETGSASEEERGSRASSSPGSSRRVHKQRTREKAMYRNHVIHGAGRRDVGMIQIEEDENAVSSVAELSPPVYKQNANSPDFMGQRGDWSVVPVHRSASQGRKAAIVESSALKKRGDLVQWGKPSRNNHSLHTTLLLDDRMSGLHLQARHPKGTMPNR